ncbi:hypothetical protein CTAYLR_000477 [Chrysophaeum taylorii]|uniref:Peptidase C1A papain C-terminal domain-containing protein n=1 Tax=Chrysophaeum taylorii TaxID=2483200 RepID=A0AAD7XLV2_9STRA|nr:hypothetical protein CTAYLR_000477 [Chrysophaeum taylorii]
MLKRFLNLVLTVGTCAATGVLLQEREELDLPAGWSVDVDVPETFSWRRIPGEGPLLTPSSNQHVPVYCGGCFLFGAFHCLQDRVKIARYLLQRAGKEDAYVAPDLLLSHQVFLNCGSDYGSCAKGGTAPKVWRWVRDFGGAPSAGCQPYLATDDYDCSPENVCRNCMPAPGEAWTLRRERWCWAVEDAESGHQCENDRWCATGPYPRVKVRSFGNLPQYDERAVREEIVRAGPVTCDVDSTAMLNYRRGVIRDPISPNETRRTDHVIELVGFGTEDDGTPYWEIRNSWGEYWGDAGFGKIYRGKNHMLIESRCYWVHPEGWGIPGTAWQDNADPNAHDAAARDLLLSVTMRRSSSTLPEWPLGILAFFILAATFAGLVKVASPLRAVSSDAPGDAEAAASSF